MLKNNLTTLSDCNSTSNPSNNNNETNSFHETKLLKKNYELGDFIIDSKLGEGAFGKVFLATHKLFNRKVAIKIMTKHQLDNPQSLAYIENEIQIHKQFHHESIVRHYCVIETHRTISMVTEYCPNGELFNYIINSPNKKLSEKESCRLFQKLISGIDYMHKHRIAHRDIKLDNLLLSEFNQLKITDFGLSKRYKQEKLKTRCGSPCYIAPEIVSGVEYSGEAIDVWSCGIVLYAMVCGNLPFYDQNQTVLFEKIVKGEYTLPSFLSPSCADLLTFILSIDPNKRLTVSQIMTHPWFAILNYNLDNIASPGVFTFKDVIPIDEDIIEEISKLYGFDIQDLTNAVILNKHNELTLAYYLTVKDKVNNKESSISDISSSSNAFLQYYKGTETKLVSFGNSIKKAATYYKREILKKMTKQKDNLFHSKLCNKIKKKSNDSCEKEVISILGNNNLIKKDKINQKTQLNLIDSKVMFDHDVDSYLKESNNQIHVKSQDNEMIQKENKGDRHDFNILTSFSGANSINSLSLNEIVLNTSMVYLPNEEASDELIDTNESKDELSTYQWRKQKILN